MIAFGIQEAVGNSAVVGEDDESARVFIETSDGKDTRDVDIFGGQADRFVVGEIEIGLLVLIDGNFHNVRFNYIHTQHCGRAIDEYFSTLDQLVATETGRESFFSEIFVDTHGNHII